MKYLPIIALFILSLLNLTANGAKIFVSADSSTPNPTGLNWAQAYKSLDDALMKATSGDSIMVSKGVYVPSIQWDVATGGTIENDPRSATFRIPSNVVVLGGFAGTETDFSQAALESRDYDSNTSMLTGELGVKSEKTDNAYHVVYTQNMSSETVLDGFTIADGFADGSFQNSRGGGWYNNAPEFGKASSPVITNCKFEYNYAFSGGAMYFRSIDGESNPKFKHCQFQENEGARGAAVYIIGDSASIDLHFEDCAFISNHATIRGGGICISGDHCDISLSITDCEFVSNTGDQNGGAIYVYTNFCDPVVSIVRSSFKDHFAESAGGAIRFGAVGVNPIADSCFLSIEECVFQNNESNWRGGAIFTKNNNSFSIVEIKKCFFIENRAKESGGAIFFDDDQTSYIDNSVFYFNSSAISGGGAVYQSDDNTLLRVHSSTFHKNFAFVGGGIHFKKGSLVNNIFWENVASYGKSWHSESGSIHSSNNLVGEADDSELSNGTIVHEELIFNQDPLFTDPDNFDWSLEPASPAIDKGISDSVVASNPTDFLGNPRIQGGSIDLGAYEQSGILTALPENNPWGLMDFSILPNPASSDIVLKFSQKLDQPTVTILNQKAVQMAHFKFEDGDRFSISIAGLTPGVYHLKVKSNQGVLRKKFLKL